MSVISRIEQAPACKIIKLSEDEKNLYTGSGWKIARFEDGELKGFFNPGDTTWNSNTQEMVDDMSENLTAWLANSVGETWLVMCSCYELCDPKRVALTGEFSSNLPSAFNRFAESLIND